MFGFGARNPQRVAEKQLNQAKLDLLEVSGALENCQAQKTALETRIARLQAMADAEAGEVHKDVVRSRPRAINDRHESGFVATV